ncbi:MAG: exo-alpha-sialidase [Pirellulales bacterium]|nr:exo-alpha-sialidase [Pirellulales bacterium]
MKLKSILFILFLAAVTGTALAAEPLAQEYVIVAKTPSPKMRADDCALVRLPGGDLLASFTFRTRRGPMPRNILNFARSGDGGKTWERLPPLDWEDGLPFVHDGKLYMLGNDY